MQTESNLTESDNTPWSNEMDFGIQNDILGIDRTEVKDNENNNAEKSDTTMPIPNQTSVTTTTTLANLNSNLESEMNSAKLPSATTDVPEKEIQLSKSEPVDENQREKDSELISPVRRTSRRSSSNKFNLAVEALKPKSSRKPVKESKKETKQKSTEKKKISIEIKPIKTRSSSRLNLLNDENISQTTQDPKSPLNETLDKMNEESVTQDTLCTNPHVEDQTSMSIDEEIKLIQNSPMEDTQNVDNGKSTTRDTDNCTDSSEVNKREKRKRKASDMTIIKSEPNDNIENVVEDDEEFSLEAFTKKGRKRKPQAAKMLIKTEKLTNTPSPFRTLETTCKICNKTLAKGGLTKHMQHHQHKGFEKKEKLTCSFCNRQFKYQYALDCHFQTHNGETKDGKFQCEVCSKVYANKSALFKHRRQGPCSTQYKCDTCGVSFSGEKSLQFHINQEHKSMSNCPPHLKCSHCGKMFVTQGGLKKHENLNQCKTDLQCHLCKKQFAKVIYFQRHMLKHEEFAPKTFQCDLCGSFLGSIYSLHKHMYRHKKIKNATCSLCNKSFFDPSALKVHMRSHNKEKPYICDVCGQSFTQSGHLCRHKLLAHQIGKFPFTCTICSKGFVDKRNIESHYKTHEKRHQREEMKKMKSKKDKKPKVEPIEEVTESNVIHIETEYDISDLLNAHMTQTNADGSQTIISSSNNLQSIEQILQAASENPSSIEYISTQEIEENQVYDEHQTIINIGDLKVENAVNENIVYTIDDNIGAVESIPASDLGILAETAQQFQGTEGITYYIIKK
ncbi:hypothetical protein SNE40_004450 [Patella caerulea]|uniref:C2H2-type domain-containing protein n=1 Tax=Patella caerulea TaxID=87958 RepID=A0AAN8K4R9_PATCE